MHQNLENTEMNENSVSVEILNVARELGRKYSKTNRGEFFLSDEFHNSILPQLQKLAGIEWGFPPFPWTEGRNFGEVANAFEEGLDGY